MKEQIKILMIKKDIRQKDMANALDKSQANFGQMLTRDDFRESELRKMAETLGCDLKICFVDKETGEEL